MPTRVRVGMDQNTSTTAVSPDADPDDPPRKPESPTDLTKPSAFYVLRKTAREFTADQCTDLAAALTYYAVLSLFPAVVVVISLLGVVGQGQRTTETVLGIVDDVLPGSAIDSLRPTIQQLVEKPFGRTGVGARHPRCAVVGVGLCRGVRPRHEPRLRGRGRPADLEAAAAAAVGHRDRSGDGRRRRFMLAISGPVAKSVGNLIGAGDVAVTLWTILRWPVILVLVAAGVAILYYIAPRTSVNPSSGGSASAPDLPSSCGSWPRCSSACTSRTSPATTRPTGRWRGGHRLPTVAVDHQRGLAVRGGRTRRRTGAGGSSAAGRPARRARPAAATARHQKNGGEERGQGAGPHRGRPQATAQPGGPIRLTRSGGCPVAH